LLFVAVYREFSFPSYYVFVTEKNTGCKAVIIIQQKKSENIKGTGWKKRIKEKN